MKNKILGAATRGLVLSVCLLGSLSVLLCASAQAQGNLLQPEETSTNLNVAPEVNFFQSALGYFTSANTNYTWSGNSLEVAAGADYMSSVDWANYVSAQYDFDSFSTQPFLARLAFEGKIRNAGIAGTVVSLEAGPELTLISYYSVKLEVGVEGGYDLNRNSPIIEPKVTLRDKLTQNTFLGLSLSLPLWTAGKPVNTVPDVGIETGFTY
jgi:hypothetical protein